VAATVVARPAGLTDEEEARAAQLEAAIVAEFVEPRSLGGG
jgi:hypothetical protein